MKVSLSQFRRMDIFEDAPRPEIVYHMTSRATAEKIIADGCVRCMGDFCCFFFPDLDSIPIYIHASGADHGRKHYGLDGKTIVTEPPLDHADTVVLKLRPPYENRRWYREVINRSKKGYAGITESTERFWSYMNDCRLVHYGDMAFSELLDVIPLEEIDKRPLPAAIAEIDALREEGKRSENS